MRIKSYECKRFAGLKDMNIEFSEGLNVILGPNESGKSSIVDGIHSTLFKNIRLRKNNNLDKDFTFKYMPKPSGDFIDGRVVIETDKGKHEIYKEWGTNEAIHFVDSDGSILKNEDDINSELLKILTYGESTYSNIVFAKQRDLKMALNNIINNSDVTDEVSDLLRRTMMELEGISIDKIQKDIENEIDTLYKRWDMDKNYPLNNRGVNNPYKTGLGTILESYYNKENLLILMEETQNAEKAFEDICEKINKLEERVEPLKEEKEEMEKIEGDVNRRAIIEMTIDSLEKSLEDLMEANKNWPRIEDSLKQCDEKISQLKEEKENLNEEKNNLSKANIKIKLEKKLDDIGEIDQEIKKLSKKLDAIASISNEDIEELSKLQREISTIDTSMKASKMIGRVIKKSDKALYLSRDFGEKEIMKSDEDFFANGVINIIYEDDFEIEIKTGDIDFKEQKNKKIECEKLFISLLEDLQISSIEEGKLNLEKIKSIESEKKSLMDKGVFILGDDTKASIDEEILKLGDIKVLRNLEEIEELLSKNRDDELETLTRKATESEKVKVWTGKYESYDNLFDIIVDKKTLLKAENIKLDDLKPLPEKFKDAEEFKAYLNKLKEELKTSQEKLEVYRPLFYEAKANILEASYEEVKKEYIEAEDLFKRNIKRGQHFLEIQRVFFETKDKLSNNPMETLVNEFARLLDLITDGDYKQSEIDEDFNIKLENINGEIPIELLSAGTYDSVTLALRFSLLKHIFNGEEGYLILDDCLVDLDPLRKGQSIKLINDFARDYQIIFTTCDPLTADMLGGNIIEI